MANILILGGGRGNRRSSWIRFGNKEIFVEITNRWVNFAP